MPEGKLFSVLVRVPASSANLGPGFDCLGMALGLYDEWVIEGFRSRTPPLAITLEGAEGIPTDTCNLAYRAFQKIFQMRKRSLPGLRFHLKSRIPVAGGLGSSSASIVAGLVAANHVLGKPLSKENLLNVAAEFEGHPDNVAPALYGGFCAATMTDGNVHCLSWNNPALFRGLKAVVAIPNFELKTAKARSVLPHRVTRADAVFNAGRASLLVGALLSRRYDLLADAMDDRLHEPYRKRLIPGFEKVLEAAESAGAYGAALSGAGPTILALAPPSKTKAVSNAMGAAFQRGGVQSRRDILQLDVRGARIV